MKKIIISLVSLITAISCMLSLSGCLPWFFVDKDESEAKKLLEQFITCLDREDKAGIKALFAPNKIADIEDFDGSVDELLSYYSGEFISYKGVAETNKTADYGKFTKFYNMSYDVTSSSKVYRMHFIWYVENDFDINNVGIWSYSILEYEEDPQIESSYGGDGSWSNGISIGKIHVKNYFEQVEKCLENGDENGFKKLFAVNKIIDAEQFNLNLNYLFTYFEGEIIWEKWYTPIKYETKTDNTVKLSYDMSFGLSTAVADYRIALKWCIVDSDTQANIGIWSFYITKAEGEDNEPYCGDGLWTNGINIETKES